MANAEPRPRQARRSGRGRRRARAALGLVAATVCAASTVALAAGTVARGRVDTSTAPVYTVPVPPDLPEPLHLAANPRVLLMGDSYSEGWGADPETEGFAFLIAEPLGWRLTRDGVGSTGFVDAGLKNQGSYPTRLARHDPSDGADLVILQGGTNDEKLTTEQITAGLDASVRVVREHFPSAQLLVMGPVAPYGTPSDDRAKLNLALADYTRAHSILYVNPVAEHWFLVGEWRTMVDQEKGHPNNVGYVRVAERFVDAVHRLEAGAV